MTVSFTIMGEASSGKNSRKIVTNPKTRRPFLIKSKKARAYFKAVAAQAPRCEPLLTGQLRMTATLYYATERPDLDAGVLLDALQGRVYKNDRQVREQHLYHAIDRNSPRAEVTVEVIQDDHVLQDAA
ncbi:MAG: RusA family crossover junction endodeoxyribonuclease [Gammaproteobacteria bacterium]